VSKKIKAFLLALLCMSVSMPQVFAADAGSTTYDLSNIQSQIKMVGRTAVTDEGIYVYWSNSGIAFAGEFEGDVTMQIAGFVTPYAYHNIAVVVDGNYAVPNRYPISNGSKAYTIANVEKGYHTIEIFKLNEAAWGYMVFKSLTINGTLGERPANKKLQMEFVGDSITCGYGIYPSGGKKEYPVVPGKQIEEEDSYFTYAALTARAMKADASFVSLGGWGIVKGGDDWNKNIPGIYDQICGCQDGVGDEAWDFANNQVDIVVCNHCTNDWKLWSEGGADQIREGVIAFCQKMRQCYPNAEIIWCYGMMHTVMEDLVREAVESVGDPKLHYITMPTNTVGGAEHPDYWGQEEAAQYLLDYLRGLGY
jgi:hypothetical protein